MLTLFSDFISRYRDRLVGYFHHRHRLAGGNCSQDRYFNSLFCRFAQLFVFEFQLFQTAFERSERFLLLADELARRSLTPAWLALSRRTLALP